jgi:wyosine [tRNA(Phe)-imidazoG37] synthetase (radical SAM superfamily)
LYKYIFGPVPSRRLGMSLGIDVIPKKVCSLDCVYCEVGKTTKLTIERKEYIPFNKIINELTNYFLKEDPNPDYFTFSGSGEPTLNSRIGDIIDFVKKKKPSIPIAVLTNGTLLNDEKVRSELLSADIVLPSLDAVIEDSFKKINRPEPTISITRYIQGLVDFRKEYSGKIYLEVFILPEYNDSMKDIAKLRDILKSIEPDKIQINTLDRPGTIPNLRAATKEKLENIVERINLSNVEIIAAAPERKKIVSYRKDAETTIIETISRRPCTLNDLSKIIGLHINEINKYLDVLESEGKIEVVTQTRGYFYQIKNKLS